MTALDLPDGQFASLSPKELEVLHLLAAGHTIKSIAIRLGRSEPSINERLRDARRKTGVGSSRELARKVAAQKIWDRNTDLASLALSADPPDVPRATGPTWTKGKIMTLIALPLAAAGLLLAAPATVNLAGSGHAGQGAAPVAAAAASPLVGTWSLDVARIPAAERPREVTIDFARAADGRWTTVVRIVAPDGNVMQGESTAAFDGQAVPVSGNLPFIDSVSLRNPAPGTLVMTLGKGGAPVSTRVYTAAKDGRSMTETIVWAGQDVPKLETTYFNRIR